MKRHPHGERWQLSIVDRDKRYPWRVPAASAIFPAGTPEEGIRERLLRLLYSVYEQYPDDQLSLHRVLPLAQAASKPRPRPTPRVA